MPRGKKTYHQFNDKYLLKLDEGLEFYKAKHKGINILQIKIGRAHV